MQWDFFYSILQCPVTREAVSPAGKEIIEKVNTRLSIMFKAGLVNSSNSIFYPIQLGIIHLLPQYSIPLKESFVEYNMEFDRARIFNYFNNIKYENFEGQGIYADSDQFVDYRPFILPYTQHGFSNAGKYLNTNGKFFIDVACGPVAFKEYIHLADNFEFRVCIDLSIKALLQARKNLSKHGQNAFFICGDMLHLPLKANVADAVLCQHALFHVPANLQKKAMDELVRVAREGSRVVIVYDWFYHSWLMNLTLAPLQLYRIARHFAGKVYARIFKKNSLYFFSHSPRWFRKNNPGKKIDFFTWRSINKYFSTIYFHEKAGGKKLVNLLWKMEEKYPRLMGKIGEYPVIVIEK